MSILCEYPVCPYCNKTMYQAFDKVLDHNRSPEDDASWKEQCHHCNKWVEVDAETVIKFTTEKIEDD